MIVLGNYTTKTGGKPTNLAKNITKSNVAKGICSRSPLVTRYQLEDSTQKLSKLQRLANEDFKKLQTFLHE
jgi:hypothetical protein